MHPRHLIRTLLLCAAVLLPAALPAAASDAQGAYTFRSYGPEQGLRNQAVSGMEQDADGFIFVSTEDGLFRYDGNRFERFSSANGLLGDSIIFMYREPGGRLWVMSSKGAVAWAGRAPDPSVKAPLLPDQRIISLSATNSGHLLVATGGEVYEGMPGQLAPVKGLGKLPGAAVWIAPDGSEALAAAQGKLYRRDARGAWQARALPEQTTNELLHVMFKDPRGRIWIRGPRVLLRLDSFDGPQHDLGAQLPGPSVLNGVLALDAQGQVWTTTNLGVVRLDDAGPWVLDASRGLPTQSATSLLFDREGNLWVSSEGVHRLQGRLAWSAHTSRQNLPSDTVWSVARSADGVLWAGTTRGLAQSTATGWQVLAGTEERTVYAFASDDQGNFWVGGNNQKGALRNALLLREAGAATFRPVTMAHLDGPVTINSMAFASGQQLYVGTQARGLSLIAPDGAGGYTTRSVALPKGGPKEQINQVLRDRQGRLWIAGMEGLALFDGRAWTRYTKADGLRDNHVEALASDANGRLIISYWNVHGLTQFSPDQRGLGAATQIDTPAALTEDNIYSLGYDARGALWLGTAQGIKRWQDGKLELFGRGEGLPSDDAAANAFWPDPNGDVWLGMASGLAHYHAQAQPLTPPPPATRVLRLLNGARQVETAAVPQVAWENRTLTFRFAVLSYRNEMRVQPQVRLVGFEDAWLDTDTREARYTGLPPGRYRFEVRASLGADDFGPVSMREVEILPPWWRTPWAWLAGALCVGGLLYLLMRWRHGRLQRRNAELASLVRARTSELETANLALHDASMIDPLTGLKNRRFLGLSMPDELARVIRQYRSPDAAQANANRTLLFYMVDLDHFKSVNDTYGHAAGDLVLQQASAALRKACRDADFVIRWGGEEFLIVARNADRSQAHLLANNLRDAVRALRIEVGGGVILEKTCSIGFAAFPVLESAPEAYAWEDAVKMADQCLYAAKRSGRDGWVGVVLPAGAADPGERMMRALGDVAAQGRVKESHSFGDQPLRWN